MKNLLALILIGLVIMCFSRCSSAKELMDKAEKKDPAIVAEYARQKYPCTDLLKPDTVTLYEDSLVFIECPDSNYAPGEYATVLRDTLWQPGQVRTVKVPVKILVPSKVITQWYEDSAKLKIAAVRIAGLEKENGELKKENESLSGKLARRTKYLWWLLALCIGLSIFSAYKILK